MKPGGTHFNLPLGLRNSYRLKEILGDSLYLFSRRLKYFQSDYEKLKKTRKTQRVLKRLKETSKDSERPKET